MKVIHAGHRNRLRERYAKFGFKGLSEHEILELLLYYPLPRRNTNEIAHELLDHFGSFKELLQADAAELCKISGISTQSALFFRLLADVFMLREIEKPSSRPAFQNLEEIADYVMPYYENKIVETPAVLLLDRKTRLIHLEFFEEGSLHHASLQTDRVVKLLLDYGADSFVLFHNHPNNMPNPSEADLLLTRKWHSLFSQLGHPMKAHILYANGTYTPIVHAVIPGYTPASMKKEKDSQS